MPTINKNYKYTKSTTNSTRHAQERKQKSHKNPSQESNKNGHKQDLAYLWSYTIQDWRVNANMYICKIDWLWVYV